MLPLPPAPAEEAALLRAGRNESCTGASNYRAPSVYLGGRVLRWGLRDRSAGRLEPLLSLPSVPSPPPPSSHPFWLAQLSGTQSRQSRFVETPIPAFEEPLALRAPCLLSGSQLTPKGLLATVCPLDFVFSPSAVPSQRLLAPAPAPAPVCPCKHKSAVCADKAMRRSGGRACRRDISRELWGRRLGGQRRLSDSRDSASPSRGLGQAPGASGYGW